MAYNGIVTLNPIMSQSSNDVNVFYLTQIQLVRYYGDEVQCDAAETYDVNDDCTVYTFHLRDGLKWSDGVDLTAKDFEYGKSGSQQLVCHQERKTVQQWRSNGLV